MDSPSAAIEAFAGALIPVETETVSVALAAGRVLASPVVADRPSPAADVSAMDGYAVRVADLALPRLPVRAEVAMGRPPPDHQPGTATRIATGGAVPPGADAVIRREDTAEHGDAIEVAPDAAGRVRRGANVRARGENAREGETVVAGGRLVTTAMAGALAAFGAAMVPVRRRVRVGVVVTGDEACAPGAAPEPWQLRDSNGPALCALLRRHAWISIDSCAHEPDDPGALSRALGALIERCDAIITTGGVSKGERDFVPGVLRSLGCRALFHGVAQRPGNPMLGAVGPRGQPVLALPGNPVSVLVTAARIGLAVLARPAGLELSPPPAVRIVNADERTIPLWWHRLVHGAGEGEVELVSTRGSGDVVSAARSDGFVEVPPGASGPGPWPYHAWG
jgi:molybdopterin molybdotransferase